MWSENLLCMNYFSPQSHTLNEKHLYVLLWSGLQNTVWIKQGGDISHICFQMEGKAKLNESKRKRQKLLKSETKGSQNCTDGQNF